MEGDQIQTQVFVLRHAAATELAPILRPLISPNNTIGAVPNSNALVITDYAGNLRRIERIVDAVDQPRDSDIVAIPLKHASALDVSQTVGRLFSDPPAAQGAADTAQRLVVIPDARSNSLLVRGGDAARITRLRGLVATLDAPTSASGNIHVVYLKNAEAARVAETLRGIYQGGNAAPRAATPASSYEMPTGNSPEAAIRQGLVPDLMYMATLSWSRSI